VFETAKSEDVRGHPRVQKERGMRKGAREKRGKGRKEMEGRGGGDTHQQFLHRPLGYAK